MGNLGEESVFRLNRGQISVSDRSMINPLLFEVQSIIEQVAIPDDMVQLYARETGYRYGEADRQYLVSSWGSPIARVRNTLWVGVEILSFKSTILVSFCSPPRVGALDPRQHAFTTLDSLVRDSDGMIIEIDVMSRSMPL